MVMEVPIICASCPFLFTSVADTTLRGLRRGIKNCTDQEKNLFVKENVVICKNISGVKPIRLKKGGQIWA